MGTQKHGEFWTSKSGGLEPRSLTEVYAYGYQQILVDVGAFQRGWVILTANFRWKGTSPQTTVSSEN